MYLSITAAQKKVSRNLKANSGFTQIQNVHMHIYSTSLAEIPQVPKSISLYRKGSTPISGLAWRWQEPPWHYRWQRLTPGTQLPAEYNSLSSPVHKSSRWFFL